MGPEVEANQNYSEITFTLIECNMLCCNRAFGAIWNILNQTIDFHHEIKNKCNIVNLQLVFSSVSEHSVQTVFKEHDTNLQ